MRSGELADGAVVAFDVATSGMLARTVSVRNTADRDPAPHRCILDARRALLWIAERAGGATPDAWDRVETDQSNSANARFAD